jgi:diguanylate cyclase (GGDEF)-like protein
LLPQRLLIFVVLAAASALFQFGPSVLEVSRLAQEWWFVAWWIAAPAFAAFMCMLAAIHSGGDDRKAWRDFSLGCGLWSAGTVAWRLYDLQDGELVFPGVADAAYVLTCVFIIMGMFHFCREQRTTRIQISNFALCLSASAIAGFLLWLPYILASKIGLLGTLVASLYPVAWFGTAAFGLMCLTVYAPSRKRFTFGLLLIGSLAQAVANLFYALSVMGSSYRIGAFSESLYVVCFLFIAWAAGEHIRQAKKAVHQLTFAPQSEAQQRAEAFIPAVALAVIFVSVGVSGFLTKGPVFLVFIPFALLFAGFLGMREYWSFLSERENEEHLKSLAHHDLLTGLGNRLALDRRLTVLLGNLEGHNEFAVLCLDLDEFKVVNDTLGHAAGDALLVHIAARLRSCIRDDDQVCRMGGDEFAIIQNRPTSRGDAENLAVRVLEIVGAPYQLEEGQVSIGLSIGIAFPPHGTVNPDQLLKRADIALYSAKADGRGTYRFYEPAMEEHLKAAQIFEADLASSVSNAELELAYQPVIDLATNRVTAFEALLRWRHPKRGLLMPMEFIPFAEDAGLIVPIGEWALQQACLEAAKWPDQIMVAVNVSASEFRSEGLPERVSAALLRAGLDSRRLELEITESVLLQNSDANLTVLQRLRQLGVKIALDDFGIGYSSLAYLRKFPFTRIKIDRSFVGDLEAESESQVIVRAIADLGHNLGIEITAEGVETQKQLDLIRSKGCTAAQGYLFSRPVPAHAVPFLIAKLNGGEAVAQGSSSSAAAA